jgi:hypothetical protein
MGDRDLDDLLVERLFLAGERFFSLAFFMACSFAAMNLTE